ncbi:MAG: transpeptidase family protein [Bacteroidales bacterium]|nr:transpeptidase family protein [Candidatus Cacconaster merdequi]
MKDGMKINLDRVGWAYVILVGISLVIIWKLIDLQFIHKPQPTRSVEDSIKLDCSRGSIISDDGRYLAFSIPEYVLAMDPTQPADTLFDKYIDTLSECLCDFFKEKTPQEYKDYICERRANSKHYAAFSRKRLLSYQEKEEVSKFPIFCKGRLEGGFTPEKIDRRQYPYGRLGYRTLGYIKHQDSIPAVGLERSCDSILRGKPGSEPIRLTEGKKWIDDTDRETIPPVDGKDIQTTINIDMQDIANNALLHTLAKSDELTAGTVVLMDVHTGEIKAMVNLEKDSKGRFDETYNYAVRRVGEPGSVFKAATLTMLLDDGLISLDTDMEAVVSWQYGKGKPFEDNYLKKYKRISVRRGFEISSNNVFRMLAAKHYGNRPQEFIDNLNNRLMITRDFPFELNGTARAKLKNTDSKSWNMADLPQIAMGYTVEVTPLHTLNFYNAIANDGVMVRPHLIRNIQQKGEILEEFGTDTLGIVCRSETAAKVREAMRCVVSEEGATGYTLFKDCPVAVAGKTGTARVVIPSIGRYETANGYKMHQATFAGFFPYEKPRYSMIVVVYSALTQKNYYGATWAGPAFREIVEKIYASSADWNEPMTCKSPLPVAEDNRTLDIKDAQKKGIVPNMKGYGLKNAVAGLEEAGYEVTFEGRGKVIEQIPAAGDTVKEKKIKLILGNSTI